MATGGNPEGTYISADLRFGALPSTVTSAVCVWPVAAGGPAYRDPNSGDYVQVAGTSASDTASGAGARQVTILGLGQVDQNSLGAGFKWYQEDIWLNGTTPTTSTYKYHSLYRMFVKKGETNAGSLYCGYGTFTSGVPANILAQINSGYGQTTQLTGSLPSSVEGHVHFFEFNMGKAGGGGAILGTFILRTRQYEWTGSDWEYGPWRVRYIGDTESELQYGSGLDGFILMGPCDVEVTVEGSGTGARASGHVAYELHKRL